MHKMKNVHGVRGKGTKHQPFKSSASGKWKRFTHAHQGTVDVSNRTGSKLLEASGLSSSHFLLTTSGVKHPKKPE
jgi:hypothetical protein